MHSMKHESKQCPRCQSTFECKVNNVLHCQCNEVRLSEATQAYLGQTEYDCLCKKCLQELDAMVQKTASYPFPKRGEPLIEGLHYYMENQFFVFTEFYHLSRGYCCQSGCRHCAYRA